MARKGKNEGTIFRRPNGSWRAQVSLDGRRLGHTCRSRAECQQWVRRTLGEIDQGMTFEERGLTLGDYLRGPQQNLRFLLPLVYRNAIMTARLADAILLGKSVVR